MEIAAPSEIKVRSVPTSYNCDHPLKLKLEAAVFNHWGFEELNKFGVNFCSRPMSKDELKVFLSTLVAFVGDIPNGIVSLALRITDEWMNKDPLNATRIGAAVLFAAVDEYGLQDMEKGPQITHHQLFLEFSELCGVTSQDLYDTNNSLEEGLAFGRRTADFYRFRSIPAALGFHYASEATSSFEFTHYLRGLKRFSSRYGFSENELDRSLLFFSIHTEVEESHRDMALEMLNKYPGDIDEVSRLALEGVNGFMDGYGMFFKSLNSTIYS